MPHLRWRTRSVILYKGLLNLSDLQRFVLVLHVYSPPSIQLPITSMKSFFVVAALAASVLAQRLEIALPTAGSTVDTGSPFTVRLHQDVRPYSIYPEGKQGAKFSLQNAQGVLQQVSVVIALTACYDVCDQPSAWGPGTVLYNGAFNPQYNSSLPPQVGLHEDFTFTLPDGWPTGGNVLSVAHLFNVGVSVYLFFRGRAVLIHVVGWTQPRV